MGKKLRDIEHRRYDASLFINELKTQITEIVNDVLRDNSNRRITTTTDDDLKKKRATRSAPKKKAPASAAGKTRTAARKTEAGQTPDDSIIGTKCPLCGKGTIIKGKTAYGCSNWKNGCTYRVAFAAKNN